LVARFVELSSGEHIRLESLVAVSFGHAHQALRVGFE
jgi:hypothetical protein